MSVKAFYQTFYQNEQLFRLAEQVVPVQEETVLQPVPQQEELSERKLPDSPTVVIVDPVLTIPPAKSVEKKVSAEKQPDQVVKPVTPPPTDTKPIQPEMVPEPPKPKPRTEPSVPVVARQPTSQINHKVLILADEELAPSDLLFLEKVLKAVNLNIDGVELLNLHGANHIDFAEVLKGKYINHFITFGVPFKRINLDIMMDRYSPVRFEGISFLMADSLPTVEADQNLKRALWNALKRVFSLS